MSDSIQPLTNAVAIVGMSGRFPDASNVDKLWRNLCEGRESVTRFSEAELIASGLTLEQIRTPGYVPAAAVLHGVDQFDAEFFRLSSREAQCTDPQHRVLLECAWEALEGAGYAGEASGRRVGVFVGAGPSNYWVKNLAPNPEITGSVSGIQLQIGNAKDYVATRVSYKLNLTGPSLTVSTACSTSLVAVHLACQSLLDFHCDLALAGGVSIQIPAGEGYLYHEGGIGSPDGHCRPFDAKAQGTVTGSGAGMVALRRLEDAIKEGDVIHAVILGSAVNNDGAAKVGFTAPSEIGQSLVIAEALSVANISPESISYIEAHGTGTSLGDPIEVAALTRVFRRSTDRRQFCALGSIKGNLGHLDEAAGIAGLIKVVLALGHRTLPPSLHFENPNPKLLLEASPFYVNATMRDWVSVGPRRAGVSSFGIGGTNAHAVLEEAPLRPSVASPRPAVLVVLSAQTRTALDLQRKNLANYLEANPTINLADVGFTLAVGRRVHRERGAVVCLGHENAIAQLRSEFPFSESRRPRPVLLFPGQGSQSAGMGAELYQVEGRFRETIDACASILRTRSDFDLLGALFRQDGASVDETINAQPALFSVGYAVGLLLQSWGVDAEAMIGHSLGEYVAATLAGVFTLEDALMVVAARGRLMQSTPRGLMISVQAPADELISFLKGTVTMASLNGPSSTVLSGPSTAILEVEAQLAAIGVPSIRLRTSHGFHSMLMDPILNEFGRIVRETKLHPPQARFISNVTGDWITASQATDPKYWVKHLREPVRFGDGVRRLLQIPECAWIESGPGRALATIVERHPDRPSNLHVLPALSSAKSKTGDFTTILTTLGELWTAGLAVNWDEFYGSERRRRVLLPTYPFERRRYWIDPPSGGFQPGTGITRAESENPAPLADTWFYAPRWVRINKPEDKPLASKAWVFFADELGLAHAAATHLRESGTQAVIVCNGETYTRQAQNEFSLPMDNSAAHARLWTELGESFSDNTNLVYSLSLVPSRPGDNRQIPIPRADHCGLLGLLALLQGLGSSGSARRLLVITNNTQAVTGSEVSSTEQAMLWGATRVAAKELPNLQASLLDLDWHELENGSFADVAADILALTEFPSARLALRLGSLWEQRIEPARFPHSSALRIREHGTYLITGGLGSMGMAFAEYLAQTARARLILVSRTRAARISASTTAPREKSVAAPPLLRLSAIEEIERAAHKAIEICPISQELRSLLNGFCASLVWEFLSRAIDSKRRGSRFSIVQIQRRLGILRKFDGLFEALLRLLGEDGVVRSFGDQIELLDPPLQSSENLLSEIARRFPRFLPLAHLIAHCVGNYPNALSGKTSAISVLYPDGTSQWLDEILARVPNYSSDATYLRAAADVVARVVATRPEIRILEVGGGTASLTTHLVDLIAGEKVKYDFTDIGLTFVTRARRLAEERGLRNMRCMRFDISRSPEAQGFRTSSYDLVLGYNVVHAAPDLVQSVRHLRSLLVDGGGMVLVETINPPRWIDLIWGLTDGWWSFNDRSKRQISPLVPLDEWEKICAEAQFATATCYPQDPDERRALDAGLIVAETKTSGPAAVSNSSDFSEQDVESDAQLSRRINRMQELGAEVCVIPADISNLQDVNRVVQTAEAHFGSIRGVIHTAGVLGQTLICNERSAAVQNVLSAKVTGTLNLDYALRNQNLDFFVLCSSLSSIDPIPGQFAYSAANAFLDSYAHSRAAKSPGLTISIDWGFWQELGMMEQARVPEAMKEAARVEILSEGWSHRGVEIFAQILEGAVPAQLIVSPKNTLVAPEDSAPRPLSHPILRSYDRDDEQRCFFSGTIVAGSAWFVDEHRIAGKSVLPGTGYLDMAVAAFWHAHGRGPVELTDVCYLLPMVLQENETRHVRLILEDGTRGFQFRIFSQLSTDCWQEHARGGIRGISASEHRRTIDFEAIETRLAAESDRRSRCPSGFWERVGSFPPHWHNVARAVFGIEEALARIELSPDVTNDLHRFALHPALLDTATGFLSFRTEWDSFVPFSIRRICVFASLPERTTSLFRSVSDQAPIFSGAVVDEAGREIVRVEDYALRRAAPSSPIRDLPGEVSPSLDQNVQLEIRSPGQLATLAYRHATRLSPRLGEIEIEVRAAGLNFIEVLYALGMLPNLLNQNVALGQECAGIVTRVGDDVTDFKPGDEVVAYGAECFSLYTTLDATAVALKPRSLSFEQAAGLPAAYLTAWYSLMHLGRLRPNERVLIHAAAGGVGLAAVRIAQMQGAEIFATAGSPEKRQFLRDLGIAHVMDSRTLAFAEDVRRLTKSEGVDIVLNSLGGDFIAKSLELLRRRGRFLELGKRDIFRNTELGLGAFANYIAFFAVDIGPDIPGFADIWVEMSAQLRSGNLRPLPIRTFAATQALEAFEHMASARHIGKVILSFADTGAVRAAVPLQPAGLRWKDLVHPNHEMERPIDQRVTTLPARAHPATTEPEQTSRPPVSSVFRAPNSSIEKKIAAVWEKLLGVTPIGAEDDFFELKGDSLLVAQVMSRLCQLFDVRLPISLIFEYPTIEQLAAQVEIRLEPSRRNSEAADSSSSEEGVI